MRYILVSGGYGMSRYLDFKDKKTANLFADGAGAAVLGVGHMISISKVRIEILCQRM
jgi:3-oxoacyl-[acyl-carrier-protein] synthase III